MSVKFRKDGYSIDISTYGNPVDDWLGLQEEILMLIRLMDENHDYHPWKAAYFLSELLPDWEDARKMVQG